MLVRHCGVHIEVEDIANRWQELVLSVNDLTLKKALRIALDDPGINKLRMLCWIVNEAEWNDTVSIAVGMEEGT